MILDGRDVGQILIQDSFYLGTDSICGILLFVGDDPGWNDVMAVYLIKWD